MKIIVHRARGKLLSLIVETSRRVVGLNLHREGGLSLTGLPSGGTTVCWGRMRARCARTDAEQGTDKPVQLAADLRVQHTTVRSVGAVMLRIGYNF